MQATDPNPALHRGVHADRPDDIMTQQQPPIDWDLVTERLALVEFAALTEARNSFFAFRRYIHPDMLWGWWTQHVAFELDRFVKDYEAGKRPKLILAAPVQHGKSSVALDLVAYVVGRNPDKRVIFSSYSEELGVRTNHELQRLIDKPLYAKLFPHTHIIGEASRGAAARWQRNSTLLEFVDHQGSFRNTTVNGQINGFALDFGVIDDPIKGRAEAKSQVVRARTWDWFVNDWLSRFAKDAAMLIISTRWHVDDPVGRYIENVPDVRVVSFPAIAEQDEYLPIDGILRRVRRQGEALFPQLKPLDFLLDRKKLLTQSDWESIYQQNPIVVGGGILPVDKLRTLSFFDRKMIKASVRYVDKAGSAGAGAYTAMVLMHALHDGSYCIGDVVRGQWSALDRERTLLQVATADRRMLGEFADYAVVVEQEPGSGGKESAEATIRNLAGFNVYADRVTGSKEVRADPFAAQVQGGNVFLLAGKWVETFVAECESFPNGRYKDQVDAAAGAFSHLVKSLGYNLDALAS